MVLTEEASGAAHVVSFEKSQCTHVSHITHTGPKCAGVGRGWGGAGRVLGSAGCDLSLQFKVLKNPDS